MDRIDDRSDDSCINCDRYVLEIIRLKDRIRLLESQLAEKPTRKIKRISPGQDG